MRGEIVNRERLGTVGEDGCHPVSAGRQLAVADGVDPVVDAVQAADGHAVLDGIAAQPKLEQLPERDYAVLPIRQGSDLPIYLRFAAIFAAFRGRRGVKSLGGPEFTPSWARGTMGNAMPLTLVLGPANSAKAGAVLGAFEDASSRGAILVVPTGVDAAHYSRELAAGGVVLGSVLTFSGLASEIADRAGYAGRRLSTFQRERVLERALRDTRFEVLGAAAGTAGFPAAAGELIAELER